MTMTTFSGVWRIIETEVWDVDALDLVGPAQITFDEDELGYLRMIAIEAGVDYRVGERDDDVCEFSFAGADEGTPISGRGWARIEGGKLRGMIFLHRGDETSFLAVRSDA